MSEWTEPHDDGRLMELLRRRLNSGRTIADVIEAYRGILDVKWRYVARLVGDGGAQVVLERAVELAGRTHPLASHIRVGAGDVDFSAFTQAARREGLSTGEVADALLVLCRAYFQTLFDAARYVITAPLLRQLEEHLSAGDVSSSGPSGGTSQTTESRASQRSGWKFGGPLKAARLQYA